KKSLEEIQTDVARAGWEIYDRKGTTWYGIAGAAGRIVKAITDDAKVVLSLSVLSEGIYGLPDLHIGLPALVGKEGIEKIWEIPLDESEHSSLLASGALLNEYKSKIF
ncbi:MAG: L-lactate dehydrogenase, partial [Brevinema sp.]